MMDDTTKDMLELEPSANVTLDVTDRRKLLPEPPPVSIVAIEDVTLPARPGVEGELRDFYVKLLGFVDRSDTRGTVFAAENVDVRFEPQSGERDEYRILRIKIPSLEGAERKLVEIEYKYDRQLGLTPGSEVLSLRDPAGNWIELFEHAEVR